MNATSSSAIREVRIETKTNQRGRVYDETRVLIGDIWFRADCNSDRIEFLSRKLAEDSGCPIYDVRRKYDRA